MDMATLTATYATPEQQLTKSACTDIFHYYDLPVWSTSGSDSNTFDQQAGLENSIHILFSGLDGANLIHDIGLLDHSNMISPDYLVLNNEVLDMVNHYMRGIPVNSEALAVDLIDRVGPGGHYLEQEHTRRHFRNVWYSELFDRANYDEWFNKGARRFKERLREQTLKLMDPNSQPLPTEIVKEIDRMEKQWHRESGH